VTQAALQELHRELVDLKGKVELQGNAIGAAFNKIDETLNKLGEAVSKIEDTTSRVDTLEVVVEDEKSKNILALAAYSERQDFQSNQSKSDCVLITGKRLSKCMKLRHHNYKLFKPFRTQECRISYGLGRSKC
jgi:hypothetical protein